MKGADAYLMTDTKPNTRPDATKANPNAVSVRIEPKTMSKAKFQRRHDFRIGSQPDYVNGDRTHLNRHLAYVKKRTKGGKSKSEIIRCLKRDIVREIYSQLCVPKSA